ncbi:hypothetical protein SMACR_09197 [Sordaria macrospora]|uniref:Uncharacterized protein n=1 Tax=Sordaria macrospora TaxID=5147 RepID=A0A8S8ZXG4_SORMA|nr:hypothetical protein SMACR_09197 [Sordaria macrospora]KAH7629483.1 hypothetical protein B0T09DRAFT_343212 [Sordaria sp. MPI-SDFR-AT-0083]WPJ66301.1 hypothetical protein SMAC4_09197 [Sordaria macrospora]
MKTTAFITALLPFITPVLSLTIPIPAPTHDVAPPSATHPRPAPAPRAPAFDTSADGLYRVTVDSEGNPVTEFTPYDDLLVNVTSTETRSNSGPAVVGGLEKRREDCGPGSTNVNDADAANKCLLDGFAPGDVHLNKHAWTYCVRNEVVSFICPYSSNGYKPRDAIQATMYYVKQKCGPSTMGYAQVSGGMGDWTTGYARRSDHFCDKDFFIGN